MVKFRGIEISIISQFDIRKLPEFRFRQTSPQPDPFRDADSPSPTHGAIANCYVPIYAGSQIWFEYSISGPHPAEGKGYLFKLFFDNQLVTSWDCTEKHEYHGKMMYNLVCEDTGDEAASGQLVRQALQFSEARDPAAEPSKHEDVIEIRVHRIEHRQRLRQIAVGLGYTELTSKPENGIQLSDGGLLEPGFPQRRYKYQLLDPVDEPYATFRFHYRTLDYLKRHGIVDPIAGSPSTSGTSLEYQDASSAPRASDTTTGADEKSSPGSTPAHTTAIASSPPTPITKAIVKSSSTGSQSFVPPSDSEESLSWVTRDSVEDLPSTVPRSPMRQPSMGISSPESSPQTFEEILERKSVDNPVPPPSPAKSPISPRRLFKKKLTVSISGTEFNIERKRRPLSPFNSGGMLRKLIPPSAPPGVTEFGPTVKDEVEKLEERMRKADDHTPEVPKVIRRTTRAERGGRQLMGFLNKRIGKDKSQ